MPWLFLAMIAVPLIEISLFVIVGQSIGLWPTLAIVIFTAILGSWLLRHQGAREMGKLRSSFIEMRDPAEPIVSGGLLIFAGALLLTPGYLTDAIGLILMIPPVREWLYRRIAAKSMVKAQYFSNAHGFEQNTHSDYGSTVIDGEYEYVEPRKHTGPSRWVRPEEGKPSEEA